MLLERKMTNRHYFLLGKRKIHVKELEELEAINFIGASNWVGILSTIFLIMCFSFTLTFSTLKTI